MMHKSDKRNFLFDFSLKLGAPLTPSAFTSSFCSSLFLDQTSVSSRMFCCCFQGMTQRFPAPKLWTVSVSCIIRFTRGALRSFKDAKMRNTVSQEALSVFYSIKLWRFRPIFSQVVSKRILYWCWFSHISHFLKSPSEDFC